MQCNIDARGKALRLISGITVTLIGLGLAVVLLAGWLTSAWWWVAAVGTLLVGVFQIFEARKGWCVVRAMGFRTPI